LWHPAGPNGTTGALADVTPELGFNGGWEYVVYCWASGTFVSEEENATIQAFGQVIDSYYSAYDQVWTLGGLDASPLAATISWSGSPDEGSGLSFDGGSNNPYSSGLSYHWDFGDGTTATDRFAYHAYGDNGQYTVRLTVADGTGGSNTVSTTITINNASPTATFSVAPQYPGEGSTYLLSVNSVSDAPGDLSTLQLTLDCGDGRGYQSVAVTGSLACSAPNETVRTAGAQLRDKDGGVTTYSSSVTVIDLPPAVSIVSAPTTISDQSNYVISFKFLDPGVLDTWSYTIYWGDGTTSSPVSVSTQGGTLSATHRYTVNKRGGTKSAQYSVTVGVTDNGGATGYANSTVLVTTNGYRP
jgi:hypothetical protein